MYIPEEFKITDPSIISEFIQKHPFGLLVQSGDLEPVATHLPFLIKNDGENYVLEGHLAKSNPHSTIIRSGKTAMTIFNGSHGYVSSTVYGHPNVPTWNYQAVHIYGTLEVLSETELICHLEEVVDHFESDRENKLDLKKLPQEMLNSYRQEIVGFRLNSYRVEAAFKLSQNRNDEDHQRIIDDLGKCPINQELVDAMKKHR